MPPAWRRLFGRGPQTRMAAAPPAAQFSVVVPPEMLQAMTAGGSIAPRISRDEALQVPAVMRARNLICSPATLPIRVHGPDHRVVTDVTYLPSGNIDPNIANSVVKAQILEDLLFEGIAWLRVTKFGWHNFPVEARHVPVGSVHVAPAGALMPSQAQISPDQPFPVDGTVYIDGRSVPDNEIIRFDSPNPPLLRHAARAIRTCLLLDTTAALYARDPQPLGLFTDREGAEKLPDDEIQEQLDKWEAARHQGANAYVSGLSWQPAGWNPEQLQLAAQRQHAVLQIAISAGLDPEDLGVSTTSRTYANQEQRWQALINTTLGGYVSAVQERLSMRDVLPRGYTAQIDFSGFLRADLPTRMSAYEVGLRVGAYTEDEVREAEHKPPLTASQRATRRPMPQPVDDMPAEPAPDMSQPSQEAIVRERVTFTSEATTVTFDGPELAATFRVNAEKRTVSGLAVPWGKVARSGFSKWRFAEGSLHWVDEGRVKLNRDHDSRQAIGRAVRLQSVSSGLDTTFKVARGEEGDRALSLAEDGVLDGFSIEIEFDDEAGDEWQPDPSDESVRLVRRATLRAVALTAMPAFDDARLTAVAASRDNHKEGTNMTTPTKVAAGQPDAAFDVDGFVTGLAESMKQSQEKLVETLAESVGESFSAGIKAALENITNPQDGPQPVRAARYTVTREAPVYALNGAGPSLVRDGWYACMHRDDQAMDRLRKFRLQTEDLAKLTNAELARQMFTTVTTANASAVIPPGYRPDLFVPMLAQGRPMVNALSRGVIENATPFVVPVFGSVTGAAADHVEGTNPADGTLTLTTKTVTPGAISGRLVLTREIVDSANPAIDQIALNAMMESYNRQTEQKIYTLLNGANGAGGTLTPGGAEVLSTVPSGAQGLQTASGTTLPAAIRKVLAAYPFRRFASPTNAQIGQIPTVALATAVGSDGRPLFPSVGATNTAGIGNAVSQGWFVDGLAFVPAWAVSGAVGATDTHVFILNALDGWAWESPLLTFRYEEKNGPANIELALFGYFASHVLRPVGLSGIRMTAA